MDLKLTTTGENSWSSIKERMIKKHPAFKNLRDLFGLIESLNTLELDVLGDSLAELMGSQKRSMQKKLGMKAKRGWPYKTYSKFIKCGMSSLLIDHPSMLRIKGGRTYYVAEPYDISMEGLESLIKFCKENGMEFKIDAHESTYYPGYTTGIFIYKKNNQ